MNFRDISQRRNSVLGRSDAAPRVTSTRQVEFPSNAQTGGHCTSTGKPPTYSDTTSGKTLLCCVGEKNHQKTSPTLRRNSLCFKTCSKCHTEYPATVEFFVLENRRSNGKGNRDGLHSWCRECQRMASRAYYAAHPEKVRATVDRWRADHPERARELMNQAHAHWAEKYPDRLAASSKRWGENHPEAIRAKNAVANAIRSGRLVFADTCDLCEKVRPILVHHPSYLCPLEGWSICRQCHKAIDHRPIHAEVERPTAPALSPRGATDEQSATLDQTRLGAERPGARPGGNDGRDSGGGPLDGPGGRGDRAACGSATAAAGGAP